MLSSSSSCKHSNSIYFVFSSIYIKEFNSMMLCFYWLYQYHMLECEFRIDFFCFLEFIYLETIYLLFSIDKHKIIIILIWQCEWTKRIFRSIIDPFDKSIHHPWVTNLLLHFNMWSSFWRIGIVDKIFIVVDFSCFFRFCMWILLDRFNWFKFTLFFWFV